jgi:hypothetical protein
VNQPVFGARPALRHITTALAGLNAAVLLFSLTAGVLGRPAGLVLAPVWLWGAIECGRAAWSNWATASVDAEGVSITRPGETIVVRWNDISWVGLTRRGAVIETLDARHVLFDQDWVAAPALVAAIAGHQRRRASTDLASVAVSVAVSHDRRRALSNLVLFSVVGLGAAGLVGGGLLADLTVTERVATVATALPVAVVCLASAIRLLRRPFRLIVSDESWQLARLVGPSTDLPASPTRRIDASEIVTLAQRVSGAQPGHAVIVSEGRRRWVGPIAAPGTFNDLVARANPPR